LSIFISVCVLISNTLNISFLAWPSTLAIGFLLSGIALYALQHDSTSPWLNWAGKISAVILLILSSHSFYLYIFHWNAEKTFPQQIILSETINFFLLSIIFVISGLRKKYPQTVLLLSFLAFSISMLIIFGYAYRIKPEIPIEFYTQTPLSVAVLYVFLSIACALMKPNAKLIHIILSHTLSGRYTRKILIYIIIVPLVVSYLENLGEVYNLYDPDFGDSLLSTVSLMLMMVIIAINTRLMHVEEQQKIDHKKILDYLTDYDKVTDLLNLHGFQESLSYLLNVSFNQPITIIKLSLNQFELVNNVSGQAVANHILNQLAERFTNSAHSINAIVARIGFNDFGFIFQKMQSVAFISRKVNELLALTSESIAVEDKTIFITASVGVSVYPQDGRSTESLIRCADQALQIAKKQAGNSMQFFTKDLSTELSARLEMENELYVALSENQFELYYQPQVDLKTGKICGAESLLRWIHPTKGMISPALFVPIAEEIGLIIPIGEWILREVCQQIKKGWPFLNNAQHSPLIPIAVNVSPAQFNKDYAIVDAFKHIINEYGVDPECIELEITESILMEDIQNNLQRFIDFRDMGLKLAIDDFGTGFSSFSYINRIPYTKVKIDKSFIDNLPQNKNDAVLVEAMIHMFHQLNKKIVVEGAEKEEQIAFLKAANCDVVQGYYFSRPLSLSEFKLKIEQDNALSI
jgi:diguanylate cyclase (GGDEF)-like protein